MRDLQEQLNTQKRKVDFDTYDITVKEIINMVAEQIIDIAPEYQRLFQWRDDRQSKFIESVLLGIPIPSLFMATNPDGTWEVIDGVQRLSTLIHFSDNEKAKKRVGITGDLVLTDLKKLSNFNNKAFADIEKSIQMNFYLKPIKVTTLSDKSDKKVRFDLFERLNTGGLRLSDQEIRNCIFKGEFREFIKELAKNRHFREVVRLPKNKEDNATYEELVLKFFAYLNDQKSFVHSVVDFLNDYMEKATRKFGYTKNRDIFEYVFSSLASVLPNGIKRKAKTPVILYEAISVGAARVYVKRKRINTKGIKDWMISKDLESLTTGATNSPKMLRGRINYCIDKFSE
ncbi:MAG: DUF262 domain-containing protein [Planctomycetes bacterium]|nr:DUF262 domain-containing protein [Planctomycetota bacterium]